MHASGKDDDENQGGTFIGIIKIDRKLMNSNIAYLIIDKDKKIIAISSSCITLLYLDLSRLERLTTKGVTLNSFCQDIQLKKDSEKPFLVTWNAEISLEMQSTRESRKTSKSDPPSNDKYMRAKSLIAPRVKQRQFMCKVEKIQMNDIGDVGHYIVRLDVPDAAVSIDIDKKEPSKAEQKKKVKKAIPNFYFKIDYDEAKFIRDAVGLGSTNGAE